MTKIKLKKITDKSWILAEGEENAGLLSQHEDNRYSAIYRNQKRLFADKTALLDFFKSDLFNNVEAEPELKQQKTMFVKGYPTKHDSVIEPDPEDSNEKLPIFRKNEKSRVYFAAGYYCINYPGGWRQAFCSKLETLKLYGFEGPFKTAAEMKTRLKTLQKEEIKE